MSEENVEVVRRLYEAFNARDLDAVLARIRRGVEFRTLLVGNETHHGHDGFREWWDDALSFLPDLNVEVLDARAVGNLTFSRLRLRGHGVGSDVPFEQTIWQVGKWKDGKAVWVHSFRTEAEALEAAGLSE